MERMLREKEVKELNWCTTKDQLADGLTKKSSYDGQVEKHC